jgi:hypothetical protein
LYRLCADRVDVPGGGPWRTGVCPLTGAIGSLRGQLVEAMRAGEGEEV